MRRLVYILAVAVGVVMLAACKRIPSYVIGEDRMAHILADIHMAESVVDMNHSDYSSDSARMVLRQSVLAYNGVTPEEFDTSIVWYAHNLSHYIDAYDKAVKILEQRERSLGTAILQASVTMSGDSVDVWPGARYAQMSSRWPSYMLTFAVDADENSEPGDVYTWRAKVLNEDVRSLHWSIYAEYTDSTVDWLNSTSSSSNWNDVVFTADSSRVLKSIRGYLEAKPQNTQDMYSNARKQTDVILDSISLVRKRLNPDAYNQRFRVRQYRKL